MGLACARRLAADGHSVHIIDLDRRIVEAALASLHTESGPHVGSVTRRVLEGSDRPVLGVPSQPARAG